MKKVIVHQGAEVELWQAVDYYELKRTGLGQNFKESVKRILTLSLGINFGTDVMSKVASVFNKMGVQPLT